MNKNRKLIFKLRTLGNLLKLNESELFPIRYGYPVYDDIKYMPSILRDEGITLYDDELNEVPNYRDLILENFNRCRSEMPGRCYDLVSIDGIEVDKYFKKGE